MAHFTAVTERIRSSLFYEPMLFLVVAAVLGQASVMLDAELDDATDVPLVLTSTVESARAVLSTIAGATITVAGIAFSVSLLIIQLASSQYSPRVVHGLFRDPFNKRVMGVVIGTFTYCLVVLRSVRSPVEDGEGAVIPNLSVAVAVVLGLTAILAIVAFINHSAHTMDVSQILQSVTDDTLRQIRKVWPERDGSTSSSGDAVVPTEEGFCVINDRNGWVQHFDRSALLGLAQPDGTVQMNLAVGHYAVRGATLCTIWPPPPEDEWESVAKSARSVVAIGNTRTMSQDVSYGVRQLADVAIKALSPGINDPTTAQDAIFHIAAVLAELLRRDAPGRSIADDEGRHLIDEAENEHVEIIALAFDEVRQFAAAQPRVCIYLLESLSMLVNLLERDGIDDWSDALREQARLVVDGAERSDLLPVDVERVRAAYSRRFG